MLGKEIDRINRIIKIKIIKKTRRQDALIEIDASSLHPVHLVNPV
jgi:hypothetical protein